MIHSSLPRKIILEKVGERLKVRFPHSKFAKILDFSLGRRFAPRGPISLFDTSFGICKGSLSHLAPKNHTIKNFKAVKNEPEVLAAAVRVLLQIWPKLTFREIGRRPPGGSLMVRVDWKLLWNDSLWCLEGVSVDFCSFEKPFILPTKNSKGQPPSFSF